MVLVISPSFTCRPNMAPKPQALEPCWRPPQPPHSHASPLPAASPHAPVLRAPALASPPDGDPLPAWRPSWNPSKRPSQEIAATRPLPKRAASHSEKHGRKDRIPPAFRWHVLASYVRTSRLGVAAPCRTPAGSERPCLTLGATPGR